MILNLIKKMGNYSAISFGIISILSACSNYEEPVNNLTEMKKTTRSETSSFPRTITQSEAISYAIEALDFDPSDIPSYTIKYALATNNVRNTNILSDTLAYVINFNENMGYAVIANDTRIPAVLAYAKKENLKIVNGIIDNPVLRNLEAYFSEACVNYDTTSSSPHYCATCNHYFIYRKIETEVHEGDPYNKSVKKEHSDCNAGTTPTCCAITLSYTQEELKYNMHLYDFPSINYCLLQGPGYAPVNPDIIPYSIIPPKDFYITYMCTYDGSVSALTNLIYDLGKAMNTSYSKTNSETDPIKAYNTMKTIGCSVSSFYSESDIQTVWTLLYNNYIVIQNAFDKRSGKNISFIIEGGENIYHSHPELSETFYAFTYEPRIDCTPHQSAYLMNLYEKSDYELKSFFGVKINI